MTQVNTQDGYVAIQDFPEGKHTLGVCNMADKAGSAIELTRDNIIATQEMLWDAIRKQGRGSSISIDNVLKIEEVHHRAAYSVPEYQEVIEWNIHLLQSHMRRVEGWKNTVEAERHLFGKLDEFLSQFEEM